jgi:hypothetical protein
MAAIDGRGIFMETVSTSAAIAQRTPSVYRAIFWGGLLAGVLDIASAFVVFGFQPGVLQGIASGLLGRDAYRGGMVTAALGAVLHFFIATVAAAVYYFASLRLTALVERAVIWGALYGVAVWLFMNLIVLPLSAFPFNRTFTLRGVIQGIVIHILFVGLPIALSVRRYSK